MLSVKKKEMVRGIGPIFYIYGNANWDIMELHALMIRRLEQIQARADSWEHGPRRVNATLFCIRLREMEECSLHWPLPCTFARVWKVGMPHHTGSPKNSNEEDCARTHMVQNTTWTRPNVCNHLEVFGHWGELLWTAELNEEVKGKKKSSHKPVNLSQSTRKGISQTTL